MKKYRLFFIITLSLLMLIGCGKQGTFKIDYEKYSLDNGLNVILHQDRSDPITAVAIQYHVGSNRETPGHTGFAHLFEHMMFQESENVGQDQFFSRIQSAGGTLNGGTGKDGTVYFEVVPKNALEMVLWMESDRMGYLLSKVTKEAFINQQNVVQNEKRQTTDNRPYGYTSYMIDKLLYPADHPYSWQVIGSMEDLTNATLQDVHDFHEKWYLPNNATLVVAGDFDEVQTKQWIKKYFGDIPSGPKVEDMAPRPVTLSETKRAYYEDKFAKSPELNMVFPTVEEYTDDSYALDMMGQLFARGKKAPLYKVIVEEKKLAPYASAYNNSMELAGTFNIRIRTFPGISLNDVEKAVFEAFGRFEEEKFSEEDLSRIKAGIETSVYNSISSVLGKSFQLARYNEYAGSPGYLTEDLRRTLAVTSDDVWRVYNKYIKGKNYVLTCVVPKGQADLAADNCKLFPIKEESAADQVEVTSAKGEDIKVQPPPSSFDRSVEPTIGPDPLLTLPAVWTSKLANNIESFGITHNELPLIQFRISLKGGMLLDEPGKIGTAALLADMLTEGTANKTPVELEEAIDNLGANITVYGGRDQITLAANCLVSKLDEVFALAHEILFEPRWDEKEFARLKDETIESIKRREADPSSVASSVFSKLVYGPESKLALSTSGTQESVQSISIDDLKAYYEKNFSPDMTQLMIVGDITQGKAEKLFKTLEDWQEKEVRFPQLPDAPAYKHPQLYFIDFPGAKQSQIRVGHLGLKASDPDYYKATVMNYKLGGSFNGVLNMILREEKGYTYGARSGFYGSEYGGQFMASSGVRSTATEESVDIFRNSITDYRKGISEEDLQFTKDALLKSNARRFETIGALLGMLDEIATYGKPADYVKQEETEVREMTLNEHKTLAQEYLHPDRMIYLVAGDAASQMRGLRKLGLGVPVLLDKEGNRR